MSEKVVRYRLEDVTGKMLEMRLDFLKYCVFTSAMDKVNVMNSTLEDILRSLVLWAKIGESSLIGPKLVQETTDKVVLIKEKLKAMRDRQKRYADNRRKPLEFEVRDRVMLKVSPCKGVVGFGKKGKLAPSFDVLVGMDRLSKRKFVIVCHEKVVEIPLEGSRKLRVQGERTLGAAKALMNAKVDDISVVRDFVDVFPEDLSGLPPQ
ncbi:hypothetical protein Tco_0939322 [Tanacetum coccineum]|uniref:Reverse transcriptase domain-containing protein n=1 Tax=Tanacetum coccineum TaxID=301880 RepID=A0ABQ5DKI5_9ASTR